jgi:RimJ/RimL family protein N-acetyltransferase
MSQTMTQYAERPGTMPDLWTDRLVLRRLRTDDADAIAHILGDFDVAKMLVRVPFPYDRKDAETWLALWEQGKISGDGFVLTLKDDPAHLIGFVSIEKRAEGRGAEIGYWLGKDHWGKGLMSEAVDAVIQRFFRANIGATLYSGVIADNPASLKIQRKLGFDISGVKEVWCVPRNAMVKVVETEVTFGSFMPL